MPIDLAHLVRRGHFLYESLDHGDVWLELDRLVSDPPRLVAAATSLAPMLTVYRGDLVCGPLMGGAFVGLLVARELGTTFAAAVRREDHDGVSYRIPDSIRNILRGRRVIVVDDAVNAGTATAACIREVRSAGGNVVAVGALIVRESALAELPRVFGCPVEAAVNLAWNIWPAERCPLCKEQVPLTRT